MTSTIRSNCSVNGCHQKCKKTHQEKLNLPPLSPSPSRVSGCHKANQYATTGGFKSWNNLSPPPPLPPGMAFFSETVLSKNQASFSVPRVLTIELNLAKKIISGHLGVPIDTRGPDQSRRTLNNLLDSNSISKMCWEAGLEFSRVFRMHGSTQKKWCL